MRLILASTDSFPKAKELLGDVRSKKAVFIPTAAFGEGWEPLPELATKPFEDIGMNVSTFDLRGKSQSDVDTALADAAVVSVCGGNTFYLLEHMKKCGFEAVMRKRLAQGAVYIGSSAGAIVCSPDIGFIDVMDDPLRACLDDTIGLNLIDFMFLPHIDHPDFKEKTAKRIATYKGAVPMIALRDGQFLYVCDKIVQVF